MQYYIDVLVTFMSSSAMQDVGLLVSLGVALTAFWSGDLAWHCNEVIDWASMDCETRDRRYRAISDRVSHINFHRKCILLE